MISKNKRVDGQNILYHYIQKRILKEENDFSNELVRHLLVDLSIWIPPYFHSRLPIILPYVVRDNSCRKKTATGEDEWGSANSKGFLRDDNTLLKGIVRSFTIRSSIIPSYAGRRLGTGFVASHIWGKVSIGNKSLISSRHHMLNSFVPNIVWLPLQISKLTDREGSFAQKFLQAISCEIYKGISLPSEMQSVWDVLTCPLDITESKIDIKRLNYFHIPENWINKRISGLISEIDVILSLNEENAIDLKKIKSSRYLPTLAKIPQEQRLELNRWLSNYRSWLVGRIIL